MGILGKFADALGFFKSKTDGDDDGCREYRQERLNYDEDDRSRHDHTWSKTSERGHEEGWAGENAKRTRDEPMDEKTRRRVYGMSVARVYPLYIAKVERKGRTKEEVDQIIRWLTGYTARSLVTGMICGIRVEDIKEPTMREIRRLDKLVDELAKGKKMYTVFI